MSFVYVSERKSLVYGRERVRMVLALALCMIMIAGIVTPVNAASFKDINKSSPVYPYAAYLAATKIMGGYPDGTFHPERTFTRAQMVVLLCKVKNLNITNAEKTKFKDVKTSHWAYQYIGAAVKSGLVTGYPGGYFRPDAPVTRAEVAAMLISLTREETPELNIPDSIKDVPRSHWARKQIAAVIDAGFIAPSSPSGFTPDSPAKREQVAQGMAMLLTTAPEYINVPLLTMLSRLNGDVSITDNQRQAKSVTGTAVCKAGDTIKTGANGEAEIQFPDGSSILIEQNTVLKVVGTRGQAVIKANGDPGTAVDFAEFELPQGRIFGILASNADPSNTSEFEANASQQNGKGNLFAASSSAEKAKKAWWKKATSLRVRVKIDMPWTAAGIRGTVWMSEVAPGTETVSVIEGEVNVSTTAGAVDVKEGHYSIVSGSGRQPDSPKLLTLSERSKWNAAKTWLLRSLDRVRLNIPLNSKQPRVSEQVLRIEDLIDDVTANTDVQNDSRFDSSAASGQDAGAQTSSDASTQTTKPTLTPGTTELPKILIPVTNYIQLVTITGEPYVGRTLTGSASYDRIALTKGTIKYQWYSASNPDGSDRKPINNAVGTQYTLTANDVGRYMLVEVVFQTKDGQITERKLSDSLGPVKSVIRIPPTRM